MNKTFRLRESALDILDLEARERSISANQIINDLVNDLSRKQLLRTLNMISVPSLTLKLVTEAITDERMIEIGKEIATSDLNKDLFLNGLKNLGEKDILSKLRFFSVLFGADYSEFEYEGKKVVVLAHYVSRKYSLFIESYWKTIFSSADQNLVFRVDDSSVMLRFN